MPRVTHVHDWQPVYGWQARYRCTTCFCFGYKRAIMGNRPRTVSRPHMIVPYRCVRCSARAVAHEYSKRGLGKANSNTKYWFCPTHRTHPPLTVRG